MAEFYDAAVAWENLLDTTYQITYGKKGVLYELNLSFEQEQFSHLSGIHHIKDIDLPLPYSKETFSSWYWIIDLTNFHLKKAQSGVMFPAVWMHW